MDVEEALRLAVALARCTLEPDPEPGDLVVERASFRRRLDPDAIGWLVAHGEAAYREDGKGPTRDVWDVTPLTGNPGINGHPYQRWENAEFLKVPDYVVRHLGLTPPDGWHSDFALASCAWCYNRGSTP